MPRTARTITVQLHPGVSEAEYAKLANAIWSLANMSESFRGVLQDSKADPDYLNNWYDEDGRNARWT
jgi:hypothetical protein